MKLVGIVLLIIGLGLAYWGYQASESLGSQLSETVTGSPTDKVMMFYIGGAVSFVLGLVLIVKK